MMEFWVVKCHILEQKNEHKKDPLKCVSLADANCGIPVMFGMYP
jgi:hypothetical protein